MKALMSVLWLVALCASAWGTVDGERLRKLGFLVPEASEEAPAFTTVDAAGNKVASEDYRGKVVLLNFWATWCPPCRLEMPDMERLYQEFRGQGLEVVAVNFMETAGEVNAFAEEQKLTYPMLMDPRSEIAGEYGVMRLPETVLIGRRGEVLGKSIGFKPWYKDDVRELMAALLGNGVALAAAPADGAAETEPAGSYDSAYLAGAVLLVIGIYLAFRRRRGRAGSDSQGDSDQS
ncbi:MAG: TlpA disulfide reductase family protein [Deltaproteobacteria bacterium]|nr:TlpA disulfide reductase family protein [Deltaproteobacteria bacterium]